MYDNRTIIQGVDPWQSEDLIAFLRDGGQLDDKEILITDRQWKTYEGDYDSLKIGRKNSRLKFNVPLPKKQEVVDALRFISGESSQAPKLGTIRFIYLIAYKIYSPLVPTAVILRESLRKEFLKVQLRTPDVCVKNLLSCHQKIDSEYKHTILFNDPSMILWINQFRNKLIKYERIILMLPCIWSDRKLRKQSEDWRQGSIEELENTYYEIYTEAIKFAINCSLTGYEGHILIRWSNSIFSSLKNVGGYVNPHDCSIPYSMSIINDSRNALFSDDYEDRSYGLMTNKVEDVHLLIRQCLGSESFRTHPKIQQIIKELDSQVPQILN
ncbi:hypothetical protein I4641_13765 [Waterburya agarophytonicola K14]|uniref:Uncharacterized protein n=1 Tax=Waterburya agarophytonicola KI4 TaxID=2874699 RepID=A0A964FGB7_9CYAN|nr:hypothetical protein [Waterburya agarophytonicola]MCC0178047.1 hypothetical protein [Waterburya agarophytonicola KI4]